MTPGINLLDINLYSYTLLHSA